MSRWEPNAQERLYQAAMELYAERGFDETKVADIAERAGLTERTFFRYYADKREVLFAGSAQLTDFVLGCMAKAPAKTPPLDVVMLGLEAVSPYFEERRSGSAIRQKIILSHPELQERETAKMTSLGAAVGGALRGRGVPEPAASLTAEAGITIFKNAFEHWRADPKQRDYAHHVRATLEELRSVLAPTRPAPKRAASARRGR